MNIQVLDKGFVKYIQHMGTDLTVVNAARVSFSKQSKQFGDKDAGLVRYLKKHNHWTPFGHCQLTVHMKMPIFVARQWMRSNVGIVYNQVSRRYVSDHPEFYEPVQFRKKPEGSIKQGSAQWFDLDPELDGDPPWDNEAYNWNCVNWYNYLLTQEVAPEMARMILPQSLYTELWMTASLQACMRIVELREDSHAQWQIQQYAIALKQIVKSLWPVSME